jgi:DNA repair exonuclease SbcCD ATPase subunit
MESRKADSAELQAKTAKLKSINSAGSLSDIKKLKRELNDKKVIIESRWGNIINLNNITVDEFISIYEVIKEMINVISTTNVITSNLDTEYRNCLSEIENIENNIEQLINHNNKIASAEDKVFILEKRPASCKDDTCPFISDALKAKSLLDDMLAIRKNSKSISQLNRDKDALQDKLNDIDNSKYLYKLYMANQRVLRFLNFGFDTFEDCIYHLKTNSNNILVTLRGVIDYENDIEEYKKINQTLTDIENKYHALSSQEDFVNMIVSDISRLQNQLNEDTNTITELNNTLDSINSDFNRISLTVDLYDSYLEKTATLNNLDESIRILKEEIETNRNNIDKLQKINEDLEKLKVNIAKLKEELKPLREERESLNYKIKNSIEYTEELNKYQSMYEKIDTLKYYCSPTTGIQLLFANMYLNKILANANRILSGLFGGIFALLPLVVTESEFRIPVAVNGGINHDDITSMSSAQVSLISMIISIALLSQTSTKLNIIVGDEIDAPFDSENRREFITILYQLMSLVKASQCVLISHNSEIPMNECDIILLKSDNDVITSGNIIWSYR